MSKTRSFIVLVTLFLAGCGSPVSNEPAVSNANDASKSGGARVEDTPSVTRATSSAAACYEVDTGDKALLRSQTFAIDFEPFKGTCFVTSHDPEFKDPPLESEIGIYRNGKKIFNFPGQFNGVTVGCWVEAVAFQDINNDRFTDVIVVGKCNGKSGSFNENVVFVNNGGTFFTRQDANYRLADFKTIKEVTEYVKENAHYFSATQDASAGNSKS